MEDHPSGISIDDHRIFVGGQPGDPGETGHQGNLERVSDDGGVGRLAPDLDGESHHSLAAESHRVGGSQVVGDDDDVTLDLRELVVRQALDAPDQMAAHVLDVFAPFPKPLHLKPGELLSELRRRLQDGPLRVHVLLADPRFDPVQELGIPQQQGVGLEDGPELFPQLGTDTLTEGMDLLPGPLGRTTEPLDLLLDQVLREGEAVDLVVSRLETDRLPDGDTARDTEPLDYFHLHRLTPPRRIPGRRDRPPPRRLRSRLFLHSGR